MLEPYLIPLWNRAREAAPRLARTAGRFIQWFCFGLSPFWIAAVVVGLVGARFLQVRSGRPEHRHEIAEAFGSVGFLYGTPQPSQSGDRVAFVQTTANGIGIFICDTATGRKQLAFEENGSEKNGEQDLFVWPWSPDDKLLVYSRRKIVLCRSDTGAALTEVDTGQLPVRELAWLTPDAFAYSTAEGGLSLVRRQPDGAWQSTNLANIGAGSSLAALSPNIVAWCVSNSIYTMNVDSQGLTIHYRAPQGQDVASFVFSRSDGTFLMDVAGSAQAALYRMSGGYDLQQIAACPVGATFVKRLNAANGGCVYLCPRSTNDPRRDVVVQSSGLPARLFTRGAAQSCNVSADGQRLFIVGVVSNEPADGLWQYEAASRQLRCVVPCAERLSPYAKAVEATRAMFYVPGEGKVEYYVFPPAHFERHRRYPLVLGNTWVPDAEHQSHHGGPLWAQALACCDAYVAFVNRDSWYGGLGEWETNVMRLYERLAENPTIDTRRVYLFGSSAETSHVIALAEQRPDLWKGVMILSGATPRLEAGKLFPRTLISFGTPGGGEHYFNYNADAAQKGVAEDVVAHPNSTHWLISKDALRGRTKAIVDFVFDYGMTPDAQ